VDRADVAARSSITTRPEDNLERVVLIARISPMEEQEMVTSSELVRSAILDEAGNGVEQHVVSVPKLSA